MKTMPDDIMKFQTKYILGHQQKIHECLPDPNDKEWFPIINYLKRFEDLIYDGTKLKTPEFSRYHR